MPYDNLPAQTAPAPGQRKNFAMRASKWFSRDNGSIGPLNAEDASRVIAAAADVALLLSPDGIVQDCAFRTSELENAVEDAGSWAGRALGRYRDRQRAGTKPKLCWMVR